MEENLEKVMSWAKTWKVLFNAEKTVGVNFSRKRDPSNPNILMDNTQIQMEPYHKHLGVGLHSTGKWGDHIEAVAMKANKRLDILRSLKWRLDRKSLNKLYISYIRPILENSGSVWQNCTAQDSERLEAIQRAAARIVTGTKKGTGHRHLYKETGWQPLINRRVNQSLSILFRMIRNETSEMLTALLPNRVGARNEYNTRTGSNLDVPRAKSSAYQRSFLPSACKNWNNLPDNMKYSNSVEQFKEQIKNDLVLAPSYYSIGERKYQIFQCQMRVGNDNLNANLYSKGLVQSPECHCGDPEETTVHYLTECTQYDHERNILSHSLSSIQADMLTTDTLLQGHPDLSDRENELIFLNVQRFIKNTKRFE